MRMTHILTWKERFFFFEWHNLNLKKRIQFDLFTKEKTELKIKIVYRLPFTVFSTDIEVCFTCQKSSNCSQQLKLISQFSQERKILRLLKRKKKKVKDLHLEHHLYVVRLAPIKPNQNDTLPIPT